MELKDNRRRRCHSSSRIEATKIERITPGNVPKGTENCHRRRKVAYKANDRDGPSAKMSKLSPRQKAASDTADAQRKLCRDWLFHIMTSSPMKTRTKADLRAEAMERFKVSKNAFDFAWIWVIEETGNRHWYEPLPQSRRKTTRTPLQ
jgi:hypothetical protein